MEYRIIDAHTHVFPDKIADKAALSIGGFYGIDPFCSATVTNLIAEGEEVGVSGYLVCSTSLSPHQTASINDYMCALDKDARFTALGTINPEDENWEEELERIKSMGLHGVKLHPDLQKFNLDDQHMIEKYKRIHALDLPILFHMGDKRYDNSTPARLTNVLKAVPDLRCIAAHMGGYSRWDEAYSELPVLDTLYFDTSSALGIMTDSQALRMIEKHGTDKFLFGTDYPIWSAKSSLDSFFALSLGQEVNKQILADNFCRLFNV